MKNPINTASNKRTLAISGFILLEALLYTVVRWPDNPYIRPVLLFGSSLAVGIFAVSFSSRARLETVNHRYAGAKKSGTVWRIGIALIAIAAIGMLLGNIFGNHPIYQDDPMKTGSDVMPQIMFFCDRFIAGSYPYQPISGPKWGYTLQPTYMPLQWLPFVPARLLRMELRWVPYCAFCVAFLYHLRKIEKSPAQVSSKWLAWALSMLLFLSYFLIRKKEFANTFEALATSYYIFLGYALLNRNTLWTTIFLAACMLSRYSLALWLPVAFFVFWQSKGIKNAVLLVLGVAVLFALAYGPFLLKNPKIYINAYQYYTQATLGEWTMSGWQPAEDKLPFWLKQGNGLASWFYRNEADKGRSIGLLKNFQVISCLATTLFSTIYYWKNKNKLDTGIFLLGSLKVYLAFFYAFVQIPYDYLYFLPLFFDLPIIIYNGYSVNRQRPQRSTLKQINERHKF
ncbi:MAG: hypothetical protein QM642_04595 [Edaphocola sp.]